MNILKHYISSIILFTLIFFSDSLKVDTVKAVKDMYQEQKAFNKDLRSIRAYLRSKKDTAKSDTTIIDTVKLK